MGQDASARSIHLADIGNDISNPVAINDEDSVRAEPVDVVLIVEGKARRPAVGFDMPIRWVCCHRYTHHPLDDRNEFSGLEIFQDKLPSHRRKDLHIFYAENFVPLLIAQCNPVIRVCKRKHSDRFYIAIRLSIRFEDQPTFGVTGKRGPFRPLQRMRLPLMFRECARLMGRMTAALFRPR